MTKWIRWWGLIAFVALVAAIAALWLLLVDGIVASVVETQGTRLVGAKVELREADLSLVPAGLTLTGLQVTNPNEPMQNAVEVSRLTLTLDGAKLFQRKIIVEEMTADGVRFGTPRKTSGAVATPPEPAPPADAEVPGFEMPSFEVPEAEEILAKEDLRTLRLAEGLEADLQQQRMAWEDRLRELPGKEAFASYQARIDTLTGAGRGGLGGILEGVGTLQAIREDIRKDLEALKNARSRFTSQLASLKDRLEEVKTAPMEDVRRLQEKYSLTPQGLANLGQTLLGRKIGEWAAQAVMWYERLTPALERAARARPAADGPEVVEPPRASGVDVRFEETEPVPEFLIRRTRLSVQLDAGELAGRIENLTPDQDVLGKPLTFEFSGDKLTGVRSISLQGSLDHTKPAQSNDRLNLRAEGYAIHDLALSRQEAWPIMVRRGVADLRVRAKIQAGTLDASLEGVLGSLQMAAATPDPANRLVSALNAAISGVSTLEVSADVTGTLDEYRIALRSDLDRILKQAAGNLVRDMSARLKKDLSVRVSEKVEGPLRDLTNSFDGFREIGGDMTRRLARGNDLLGELVQRGVGPGGSGGLPGGLELPF